MNPSHSLENQMRTMRLVATMAMAGLAGCSYGYRNPAEQLGPGEVAGRTVAGVELLLDGVAVSVKGSALDASSRPSGRFAMLPLQVGRHTLIFRKGTDRALRRQVEIGWGKDGQPEGLWLGDVEVPASAGIYGECAVPSGTFLADNGVAVDEESGAIVPINGGSYGDFTFEGLPVGVHHVRVFASDDTGGVWVGGPATVTLLPTDAGTVKSMARFALHPADTTPAAASVTFRFGVAGTLAGLKLSDLQVTGLLQSVGFASDGSAQVDLPEGLWTIGVALPPGLNGVTPPPLTTFVAVGGEVLDLGTLYAVTDAAAGQAATSCRRDADCAPGTCGQAGFCIGWTPAPAAPASVPICNADWDGCTAGLPLGGIWNGAGYDPPYTMTCAAVGAQTVGVACGACCTPNGLDVACGEPGVGGCPAMAGRLVLSPIVATQVLATACSDPSTTFTVSGGTPPYGWFRDVGSLYNITTDTTQAQWSVCDYTITPGVYTITVNDSGTPAQSAVAHVTVQ
jgi:hypothetical protein